MTNYNIGARLERLARAQLERAGYYVVRSAGSKGAVDLVAWNGDEVRFIQVKANGAVRPIDFEKLKEMACPKFALREIWERDGGKEEWKIVLIVELTEV